MPDLNRKILMAQRHLDLLDFPSPFAYYIPTHNTMAKKVKTVLKLQLPAGAANPAPPVGTVLGPQGINIQDFCKQFNEATKDMKGDIVPAQITIFEDRSFSFTLKTPPAAALLKQAAGIEKGSGNPLTTKVGKVTRADVRKIAE